MGFYAGTPLTVCFRMVGPQTPNSVIFCGAAASRSLF